MCLCCSPLSFSYGIVTHEFAKVVKAIQNSAWKLAVGKYNGSVTTWTVESTTCMFFATACPCAAPALLLWSILWTFGDRLRYTGAPHSPSSAKPLALKSLNKASGPLPFTWYRNCLKMAEIIQKALRNVVEDTTDSALEQIPLYFSSKYIQHVDDKTIDYQHFIDHMKAQKKAVASVKITFERLIEAGSQIGSVHVAHAI